MKVYLKKGNTNYKEKRLINELNKALEKKMAKDPNFSQGFEPARDYNELKQLHDKYCVEDVAFEEVAGEKVTVKKAEPTSVENNLDDDTSNDDFIDPFNREQPIVRDYVKDGGFSENPQNPNDAGQTTFDEPTSFTEAFEMPSNEPGKEPSSQPGNSGGGKAEPKPKKPQSEPVNPAFDEMSNGEKARSTKRFAKYIVETVCMLMEKGFVWYANKDINDSKLTEYELSGEIDLSLLISLDENQQITVKQFFQSQCGQAEEMSKIEPDEKKDLAEALAKVMMEKGIAATPTQELILIALKIVGGQAIKLIALKSQTNALLKALRQPEEQQKVEQPPQQRPQPQHQPFQQQQQQQEDEEEQRDMAPVITMAVEKKEEESPIIDTPIATIE